MLAHQILHEIFNHFGCEFVEAVGDDLFDGLDEIVAECGVGEMVVELGFEGFGLDDGGDGGLEFLREGLTELLECRFTPKKL